PAAPAWTSAESEPSAFAEHPPRPRAANAAGSVARAERTRRRVRRLRMPSGRARVGPAPTLAHTPGKRAEPLETRLPPQRRGVDRPHRRPRVHARWTGRIAPIVSLLAK